MQNMKFKNLIVSFVFIAMIWIYFCACDAVAVGVKNGLQMCYGIIIPSLYPFMVVSSLIASSRYADAVSMPFAWIFRLLNINNRRVMTCCMLSILGGFATGGYLLNEINETENHCKNMMRIISVLMTMNSPAFVISAVGLHMLGNVKIGVLLYISVLISAFITAFILSFVFVFEDNKSNEIYTCRHISAVDAIKSSLNGILNICGVVIVVSALCEVVSLYIDKTIVNWAFSLVCEVTTACNFVTYNFGGNIYLICICLCILPVSSCMQIKSFDKNGAVDIIFLIFSKILQLPIALALLRILLNIFPVVCSVYSSSDISVNRYWNSPAVSFCMLFMSLYFAVFLDKKTGLSQ